MRPARHLVLGEVIALGDVVVVQVGVGLGDPLDAANRVVRLIDDLAERRGLGCDAGFVRDRVGSAIAFASS